MAFTTAVATPPETAKPRPSREDASKSLLSSASDSNAMPFASIIPASSSNVRTKSTSDLTERRIASSFLAEHGPTNTIFALGWFLRIRRADKTMGVSAIEMASALSGNSIFAIADQDGQQLVPINGSFSGTSSKKSSASCTVHISAPVATSSRLANPSCLNASRSLPTPPLPNWPTNDGATVAITSLPWLMAVITWKIWLLSAMAPKGQLTRHCPQETHFS